MEYKIDETFYLGRKKFKVVPGNCEECYFGNKSFEFCENLKEKIESVFVLN